MPFPYEKLDHVAVPDFEAGAMENAGLITYREPALLVDEATASSAQRLNVVVDVSHEIAHQWFGDLVTMAWWDDLWLNESFADLMETKMTAAYLKDSRYDMVQQKTVHGAMFSEELSGVNPIVPVLKTEPDIFGFDYGIVYQKGGQVLEMFERFLGEEKFRRGIRRYLETHRDANATRADLMKALAEEGTDLGPALSSFVEHPGVPLVRGELRCDGGKPRVHLTQTRQRPLGSSITDGQRWEIPVCVHTSSTGARPDCLLLRDAEADLSLRSRSCPSWFALNADAKGYYRWMLPRRPAAHAASQRLPFAAAHRAPVAGQQPHRRLPERDARPLPTPWPPWSPSPTTPSPRWPRSRAPCCGLVREHLVSPEERPVVEAYTRKLYAPALARLGWTARRASPRARRASGPGSSATWPSRPTTARS